LNLEGYNTVFYGYFWHVIILSNLLKFIHGQNLSRLQKIRTIDIYILIALQKWLMSQFIKFIVHLISVHVIYLYPRFLHHRIQQSLLDFLNILLPCFKNIVEGTWEIFVKFLYSDFKKCYIHAFDKLFFFFDFLGPSCVLIDFFWEFLKDFLSCLVFIYSGHVFSLPDFFLSLLGEFFLNLVLDCVNLIVFTAFLISHFQFWRGLH